MTKQVTKEAYDFLRYCYPDRWTSYYHQLKVVIELSPKSILEVGTGDGVFKQIIRAVTDISYRNLDVAEDLGPDLLGSVEKIPLPDKSVDIAVAFEVLEHLPFEKFEQALKELARIAQGNVIISLPHFGPPFKFLLKVPLLPEIRFAWKIPYPKPHVFNGQHYWEIGKRGYSLRAVQHELLKHFSIEKEFIPFGNQYHHFFVLKPRT